MQIEQKTVKNILVVRNDRFGEFLLNIPALRALKEAYPAAKITAVVDPYVTGLAQRVPFIDQVLECCKRGNSFFDKLGLIRNLQKMRPDIAVILNPSKEFNLTTFLAGIPVRAGYNRKWGFLLTHKIKDRKYLGERHEVEYNLELVALLGAAAKDRSLILSLEDTLAKDLFGGFHIGDQADLVALHPWTSDPVKQWPQERFRELAGRLAGMHNIKLLIVGGKEEQGESVKVYSGLTQGVVDLTGRTSLVQLAAILKRCRLLISGDSGPVHLACAVNTQVVALFRGDIPAKASKRWGPWGKGNYVIEKDNLADITVEEVFCRVKEVLKRI
ncbi:glycosyltransferase family 9 protein [Candidatus Omnitrophota bacterium]